MEKKNQGHLRNNENVSTYVKLASSFICAFSISNLAILALENVHMYIYFYVFVFRLYQHHASRL